MPTVDETLDYLCVCRKDGRQVGLTPTKVIFLDIDGVLNSVDYMLRMPFNSDGTEALDPEALVRFDRLLSSTDALVVISSTWRILRTVEKIKSIFVRAGFSKENAEKFIDKTPGGGGVRWPQIQEWLAAHPEVQKFIILDDDRFGLEPYFDRLVHTPNQTGMLDQHVEEALRLLAD